MRLLVLLIQQIQIGKHLLNLLLNLVLRRSLERTEHPQMILRRQVVEQNIVLGADAEHGPESIHVVENVETEDLSFSFVLLEHTG